MCMSVWYSMLSGTINEMLKVSVAKLSFFFICLSLSQFNVCFFLPKKARLRFNKSMKNFLFHCFHFLEICISVLCFSIDILDTKTISIRYIIYKVNGNVRISSILYCCQFFFLYNHHLILNYCSFSCSKTSLRFHSFNQEIRVLTYTF